MEFSRSNEDFVCYQLWSEDIVENALFARSKYLKYLSQYTSEYLWNNVNFTLSLDVRANGKKIILFQSYINRTKLKGKHSFWREHTRRMVCCIFDG